MAERAWLTRPVLVCAGALAAAVGLDLAMGTGHWPGFAALYGLAACLAALAAARLLGAGLGRPEDHYDA